MRRDVIKRDQSTIIHGISEIVLTGYVNMHNVFVHHGIIVGEGYYYNGKLPLRRGQKEENQSNLLSREHIETAFSS